MSAERIQLIDPDADQLVAYINLPEMPQTNPRSLIVQGDRYVEAGLDSFYKPGQFIKQKKKNDGDRS